MQETPHFRSTQEAKLINCLLSMWRSSGATLRASWITKLITLPLRGSPVTLWRKLISDTVTLWFKFFGHYPELIPIGLTGKSIASLSHSVLSITQQTYTASTSLQTLHQPMSSIRLNPNLCLTAKHSNANWRSLFNEAKKRRSKTHQTQHPPPTGCA